MPRVQAIVCRGDGVLMVKHRQAGQEWWCLPGGGMKEAEAPAEGALRELREECGVQGTILRQTSRITYAADEETYSFLVDIGDQQPSLGCDPDVAKEQQVLADLRWMRLCELPERDRVFLWAAGLLGAAHFLKEVEAGGDQISYPA